MDQVIYFSWGVHARVLIAQFLMPLCSFDIFNGDSHPSLQFFAEKKGKVYLAVPFSRWSHSVGQTHLVEEVKDSCILSYLVDR